MTSAMGVKVEFNSPLRLIPIFILVRGSKLMDGKGRMRVLLCKHGTLRKGVKHVIFTMNSQHSKFDFAIQVLDYSSQHNNTEPIQGTITSKR